MSYRTINYRLCRDGQIIKQGDVAIGGFKGAKTKVASQGGVADGDILWLITPGDIDEDGLWGKATLFTARKTSCCGTQWVANTR